MNLPIPSIINTTISKPRKTSDTIILAAVIAFLFFNVFKLTLFNFYLLPKQTAAIFEYKLLMTLLIIIIIYPLIYSLKAKWVLITAYIIQSAYILINICYYKYFGNYLHVIQAISLLKEGASVAENGAIPLTPQMLIIFIDLPFFVILLIHNFKNEKLIKKLHKIFKIAMLVSLCAVVSIEAYNANQCKSIANLMNDTYSGESPIVERYGTVANNIVNLYLNSNENKMISQFKYGNNLTSNDFNGSTGNSASVSKPNYVIIQVESMDANIVNQQYRGSYITPFLHSLENSSVYYPYTLSYHEGGGTSDSEFSVMDSVEPLQFFPALKLTSYSFPNSFVSKMDDDQYSTFAFHGNVGSFYNRGVAFPKMGFQVFDDMVQMKLPENGWGIPDSEVFDYGLGRLEAVKQPFMSYTITMTSHEPFNSARNYYNNSLYDDIEDKTVQNYYNSFSYVDESIKNYVQEIQKNFKNSYIIIYGDHTPGINSNIYKQASFNMDGRYFEFVPMFVITPDGQTHKETSKAASFIDVSPTVLQTSGISFDLKSNGQNLTLPVINDDNLPFKGGSYSRSLLFKKASETSQKSQ